MFFDLDQSIDARRCAGAAAANADWMKRWTSTQITVEGHCDSRGSSEYNLALGTRRADAVKDYLVSLGVPAEPHHRRQQGQGTAGLQRRERGVLAAEPARPLHHHREVGSRHAARLTGRAGFGRPAAFLVRRARLDSASRASDSVSWRDQGSHERRLGDPVLRHLPAVHHQDGNLESVRASSSASSRCRRRRAVRRNADRRPGRRRPSSRRRDGSPVASRSSAAITGASGVRTPRRCARRPPADRRRR